MAVIEYEAGVPAVVVEVQRRLSVDELLVDLRACFVGVRVLVHGRWRAGYQGVLRPHLNRRG